MTMEPQEASPMSKMNDHVNQDKSQVLKKGTHQVFVHQKLTRRQILFEQ